jgi:hypothetical protein
VVLLRSVARAREVLLAAAGVGVGAVGGVTPSQRTTCAAMTGSTYRVR